MKNWKLLCCGLLIVATGCASSSNSRYGSRWKQQKSTSHARLYNNGSHPSLGKLPQTDVPLVVNDAVMKWVGYFTGSPASRDRFARYLQRSGRYMDMMRETLRQHGMPQDLIYVALIESGFRNDAQSWASAVGTWQFIRGTARGYGLNIDSVVDERRDPEKAVDAAARYLKTLHAEFGDWYLAMAGYNAGEGRVRRAIARYGTNNFWQLAAMGNGAFRPETRDYVPKYIAATIIAKNPKRFGFHHVDYHEPLNYDTAQIKGQADLMAVADAVNVPVEVIKELNSELYAGVTPPGQYLVKLPVGTSQRFKREFPRVAKKYQIETRSMLAYRVRRGDSLGKIARRYGISARQLQAANRLRSGYLRAGQVLSIPAATRREASRAHVVAVAESPLGTGYLPANGTTTGRYPVPNGDTTTTSYTVRPGDRLSAISRNYGVTISSLRRWNKLRSGNLRVGQLLRIKAATDLIAGLSDRATGTMDVPEMAKPVAMVAAPVMARRETPKQSQTYRVRRGDVLSTIARRNGVTVRDLQAWNGLRGNRIMVGQQLRMTAPAQAAPAPTVIARVTPQSPRTTHTYRVQRGDSLYVIAKRYGVTVHDLQAWNRMGNNTLRAGQQLVVQKASSPTTTAAQAEPRGSAVASASASGYRVRTGDTLGEIAERHNMTVADLRRLNRLSTRAVIRGGQTLKVRGVSAPSTEPSAPTPTLALATPQETASKSLWTDRVSLAAATKPKAKELIYQVKPGDTLWDISKAYEVSPEEIQTWNNMNHPNLKPGQKLTIRITS